MLVCIRKAFVACLRWVQPSWGLGRPGCHPANQCRFRTLGSSPRKRGILMPILPLGLSKDDVEKARTRASRSTFQQNMERYMEKRSDTRLAQLVGGADIDAIDVNAENGASESLRHPKPFNIKSQIILAVYDMAYDEEKMMPNGRSEAENRLFATSVNNFTVEEFSDCFLRMHSELEKDSIWGKLRTMCFLPFGILGAAEARDVRAAERSCIWRAQLESVYQATCNSIGISLFLIPLAGPFLGKICHMFMGFPGCVYAEGTIARYSFFATMPDPETGNDAVILEVGFWSRASYGLCYLRVACAGAAVALSPSMPDGCAPESEGLN
ncbi:unnamed protein product [Symbiodinium sp. CCMP2456]|nr:unnamed protein product [Symbiodinium sp. CCMP2456]